MNRKHNVFISYRNSDGQVLAETIYEKLNGYCPYYSKRELMPGEAFPKELEEKVRECKVFILVVTNDVFKGFQERDHKDDWVYKEISIALEQRDKVIIPFIYDGCSVPFSPESFPVALRAITEKQGLDYHGNYGKESYDKLVRIVKEKLGNSRTVLQKTVIIASAVLLVCAAIVAAVLLRDRFVNGIGGERDKQSGETSTQDANSTASSGTDVTDPELEEQYADAVNLLMQKHYGESAIAFYRCGDYKDAAVQCEKAWGRLNDYIHFTLLESGSWIDPEGNAFLSDGAKTGWSDIVSLSENDDIIAGLKSDGTVLIHYFNKSEYEAYVAASADFLPYDLAEQWSDIVSISAAHSQLIGLKKDGTAVACGDNCNGACNVEQWHDIVSVSTGGVSLGVKSDGSCVTSDFTGDEETVKALEMLKDMLAGLDNCQYISSTRLGPFIIDYNNRIVRWGDDILGPFWGSITNKLYEVENVKCVYATRQVAYVLHTYGRVSEIKAESEDVPYYDDSFHLEGVERLEGIVRIAATVDANAFYGLYCVNEDGMLEVLTVDSSAVPDVFLHNPELVNVMPH